MRISKTGIEIVRMSMGRKQIENGVAKEAINPKSKKIKPHKLTNGCSSAEAL